MRVLGYADHACLIELSDPEATFLRERLNLYPCVSNNDRYLTRDGDAQAFAEDTELLRSSLNDFTKSNQQRLHQWLASEATFTKLESGWQLHVADEDRNWLLQILNDLRVGCWHQLDCPSQDEMTALALNADNFRQIWTMELCGLLQSFLLSH